MDLMDYRRKIIANSPHLMSASGAVVSFSDGADLPLKSLLVNIEPVQSGSGDPSPTNIRPISGWNGVKVIRSGKNLLALPFVYYTGVSTDLSNYFFIKAGTYVFSFSASTASSWRFIVRLKDLDGNTISDSQHNPSNTLAYRDTLNGYTNGGNATAKELVLNIAEDCYIRILNWMTASPQTDTFNDCKLEEGSTATPYEPYNGVDVSVDLGQTVYSGTLNTLTGVLAVDRAMVDLGTLTWNTSSSGTNRFYSSNNGTPIYDKNNGVGTICSQYKYDGFEYPANSYYGASGTLRLLGTANSQTREIYIVDDAKAGKTGAQFKADMSGVQLVYRLATPFEVQLTPHQIRSLYGNNTIFADTGNVALEYWAHP